MRKLSEKAGRQFEGLQQAARWFRNEAKMDNATMKKIFQLDVAYNVVRHLTAPGATQFIEHIVDTIHEPDEETGTETETDGTGTETDTVTDTDVRTKTYRQTDRETDAYSQMPRRIFAGML